MFFGNYVRNKLDSIEQGKGKNAGRARAAKQEIMLQRYLYGKPKSTKGRFRDPAEVFPHLAKGG